MVTVLLRLATMFASLLFASSISLTAAVLSALSFPLDREAIHVHSTISTLLRRGQLAIETFPPLSYLFTQSFPDIQARTVRSGCLFAAGFAFVQCFSCAWSSRLAACPDRRMTQSVVAVACAWAMTSFQARNYPDEGLEISRDVSSLQLVTSVCLTFWAQYLGRLRRELALLCAELLYLVAALVGDDWASGIAVLLIVQTQKIVQDCDRLADTQCSIVSHTRKRLQRWLT